MKKIKFLLLFLPLLSGCGSLQSSHTVTTETIENGKVTKRETLADKNGGRAVLMKTALEKMHSSTSDKDYKHSISASGVQASGDVDMIKAIGSEVRQGFEAGIGAAAKAVVPIP